jgi:hypothetical protein
LPDDLILVFQHPDRLRFYSLKGGIAMDSQIEQTLSALRKRHINGTFARNLEDASQIILDLIPVDATVGIGDSTTLRQLGVLDELKGRGTKVLMGHDPQLAHLNHEDVEKVCLDILKQATVCDVFLTGTHALTKDGRLVNVDATGNRVAGMFWGHPLSIIVVGKNKIVENLDEAFHLIRHVIAPSHIHMKVAKKGSKKVRTPCAETGDCSDCRSSDRRCNIFTIIESKPKRTNINVIIVGIDLGLGWNTSWPQERIMNIKENYKKFVHYLKKDMT